MHQQPPEIDGRTKRRVENGARLFDAAMELLATRSYDDIAIEEICAAAGVGRATFFRIYQTKAELLLEFNRRLATRVQQRLDVAEPMDVEAALRIVGEEIAETWTQAAPGATALAVDFSQMAGSRGLHAGHPELLQIVVTIVEKSLDGGQLTSTLPVRLMASLALLQITAPVSYWFRHPERDLHVLINESIVQWLHGVVAH
ncbi:MAG: TetR/AcrR family transcriptional regulator [Pseudomonadales bacterium]|nr:TetR/AcrR family transcriptional regulator [Pseudomonadales bacterium]